MKKLLKRFRHWLVERYLPRYAYETAEDERHRLERQLAAAQETISRQQSYIAGLEYALRHSRVVLARGDGDGH